MDHRVHETGAVVSLSQQVFADAREYVFRYSDVDDLPLLDEGVKTSEIFVTVQAFEYGCDSTAALAEESAGTSRFHFFLEPAQQLRQHLPRQFVKGMRAPINGHSILQELDGPK